MVRIIASVEFLLQIKPGFRGKVCFALLEGRGRGNYVMPRTYPRGGWYVSGSSGAYFSSIKLYFPSRREKEKRESSPFLGGGSGKKDGIDPEVSIWLSLRNASRNLAVVSPPVISPYALTAAAPKISRDRELTSSK